MSIYHSWGFSRWQTLNALKCLPMYYNFTVLKICVQRYVLWGLIDFIAFLGKILILTCWLKLEPHFIARLRIFPILKYTFIISILAGHFNWPFRFIPSWNIHIRASQNNYLFRIISPWHIFILASHINWPCRFIPPWNIHIPVNQNNYLFRIIVPDKYVA